MSDAVARVGVEAAAPIGMTDRTVAGIREVLAGSMRWRSRRASWVSSGSR